DDSWAAISRPAAVDIASRMSIGDIPRLVDGPALDGVEVIDRSERTVRPADGDQLLEGWLHIAGLVGAATLQHRGLAVPDPREAEAHRADVLRRGAEVRG